MNRRHFLATAVTFGSAAALLPAANALAPNESAKGIATGESKLVPPANGGIPVAILISAGLNVIDFSGPWGVFESVSVPGANEPPFHLFTVAENAEVVTSGSGLKLMPHYTFGNVPEVKVVVIPAQRGSDAMIEWLRKVAPKTDVTMSVCTGAFKLAKAGLLSGKAATTHHDYLDKLQKEYPDIQVKRGVRFVEGEKISTAGGLTSGPISRCEWSSATSVARSPKRPPPTWNTRAKAGSCKSRSGVRHQGAAIFQSPTK